MIPTTTRGATHLFSKPKNWDDEVSGPCGDLQVRAETFSELEIVELISTWKPSAHELAELNEGGVIEIGLCVTSQPPMRVYIVDPVEPALLPYVNEQPDLFASTRPVTINEAAHGDDA